MIGDFRNTLLLINFFLLLLLNYGYMQLRIPQAQIGVPISEWLLLLTLLTVHHPRVLPRMRGLSLLLPYFLWLGYGTIIIVVSYFDHGIRAVRDGLPVIEALFLYAGFVFAGNKTSLATLAKWFPRILVVGVFYCTLYPFREALRAMSPVVSGMQGQPVPVFFTFVTSQMLLVVAAAFVLERYRQTNAWRYLFFAAVAVSLPLVLIPSRTLLLMILMLFTYFFFSGKLRLSVGMAWVVGIGMALFVALFSLGIENTRLGLTSLTDYKTLFFEIFPGTESTDPLTSGASSRLRWWSNIYQQLTASWEKLVFGLGYGIPLTDLGLRGGVVIYAPHNTLVSVVARGGLVAGFVFVWLQFTICAFSAVCVMEFCCSLIFYGWATVRSLYS